jgi:alpha-aminoadipate carrier protein LysW
MATCPVCEATDLEVDEYEVDEGDIINCPDCGASLQVTGVSPLELEASGDEDEDDDDEDEDKDDDEDEDLDEDDDEDDDDEREDWDE